MARTSRSTTSTSTTCRRTAISAGCTSTRSRSFPYNDLVAANRARTRQDFEYELLDTGVFDENRYFDVEVEHAKAGPEDILCRITVHNRSAEDAALHVLPTLWFRNTWSWEAAPSGPAPALRRPVRAPGHPGRASPARRCSTCTPSPARSCCSARTRRTRPGCGEPSPRRRLPKTASAITCCTARPPSTRRKREPRRRRTSG